MLMRRCYSALLFIFSPIIVTILAFKSRHSPNALQGIQQRFGFHLVHQAQQGIWFHAASVGEVRAALPLIQALQTSRPDFPILITTQTQTGLATAKNVFSNRIACQLLPLDLPFAMNRLIRYSKPKSVVILETEIWPNLLYGLKEQGIPIFLANARLSATTVERYQKLGSLFRSAISSINHIFAQSTADAERFIMLGATQEQLCMSGNLKFDITINPKNKVDAANLKQAIGVTRPIWIAASTHDFEEDSILSAFVEIKKNIPAAFLIWVPRHPERFNPLAKRLAQHSFKTTRWSTQPIDLSSQDILLVDCMGLLSMLYYVADVAFIGNSLHRGQGHNPLEAAAAECAIITGPNTASCKQIISALADSNALVVIHNENELIKKVVELLTQPEKRTLYTSNATHCLHDHRGAVAIHLNQLLNWLANS